MLFVRIGRDSAIVNGIKMSKAEERWWKVTGPKEQNDAALVQIGDRRFNYFCHRKSEG